MSGNQAEVEALQKMRQWLHTRFGMYFDNDRLPLLFQRLTQLVWQLELGDIDTLYDLVARQHNNEIIKKLADIVSTNHTYFFREPEVLDAFRSDILPELQAAGKIRIWSAAASSGEETYTLAIIITEVLGLEAARSKVSILGTDINSALIHQAEACTYPQRKMSAVPKDTRKAFFRPAGLGQWTLTPEIKKMCLFRRLNLKTQPWPFSKGFSAVFCRNVLYYFDRDQQREVTQRIYDIVPDNGWLITGVSESLHGVNNRWRLVRPGIYRKR